MITMRRTLQKQALHSLSLSLALLAGVAMAQQDGRLTPQGEGINDPPTLEERIVEERSLADQAAREVLDAANQAADSGIAVPRDAAGAPMTHASRPAPLELLALAAREPERFIGKTLVLDDGVDAIEVGPVLDLRKRILDQEPHLIVDATAYFNTPTHYAVAVADVEKIEGDYIVTPEAAGMHLRGLEYYPEDYTDIRSTAPEDVLADNVDLSEDDGVAQPTDEPGVIPLKRF